MYNLTGTNLGNPPPPPPPRARSRELRSTRVQSFVLSKSTTQPTPQLTIPPFPRAPLRYAQPHPPRVAMAAPPRARGRRPLAARATAILHAALRRVSCRVAATAAAAAPPPQGRRLTALHALLGALWVASALYIANAAARCARLGGASLLSDDRCRVSLEYAPAIVLASLLARSVLRRREAKEEVGDWLSHDSIYREYFFFCSFVVTWRAVNLSMAAWRRRRRWRRCPLQEALVIRGGAAPPAA